MYLSIFAGNLPRGIDEHRSVVVQPGTGHLEDGRDDVDPMPARSFFDPRLRRAVLIFRIVHKPIVPILREVLGVEELRQHDQLCAAAGGLLDQVAGVRHILVARAGPAIHLDESDSHNGQQVFRIEYAIPRSSRPSVT
jgi:hypothetical protein